MCQLGVGRQADGRVYRGLVLDGGQTAQASLPATTVVGPLAHHLACCCGFAGEEPVADLGIAAVGVEQHVRPVCLDELSLGDLLFDLTVIGLAGELQGLQRHRDRDSVVGEFAHERVEDIPGRFAWER